MRKDYVKIEKEELKSILFISLILGIMFALTFVRFQSEEVSLIANLIVFFLFVFIVLSLRLLFMKWAAYKNGFEINMYTMFFDRYGFLNYDRLSYTLPKSKGIAMPFLSLFVYILTLGVVIFPSLWNYKTKIIPHRHTGVKQRYEGSSLSGISFYRFGKVMFASFLFYVIFAFFLKVFSAMTGQYFYWFLFVVFWIAFVTLIPIPGTEGYDFFIRSNFGWISSLVVLVIGLITVTIFQSIALMIAMSLVAFVIVILVLLWKDLI